MTTITIEKAHWDSNMPQGHAVYNVDIPRYAWRYLFAGMAMNAWRIRDHWHPQSSTVAQRALEDADALLEALEESDGKA